MQPHIRKITVNSTEQHQEKRKYDRVEVDIPLTLQVYQWKQEGNFKGEIYPGILYDVSEGGLNVRTNVPLSKDMFLQIQLPSDSGLPPLIGRIIRCKELGPIYQYGCLVTGLSLIDQRQLETYIQHKRDTKRH
jgi:hypothetical protein